MRVIDVLSGRAAIRCRLPFFSKIGKIHSGNRLEKFAEMSAIDKAQVVSNLFHSYLGKAAKAFALQDKGQEIEVMTEDDFLRSL